MKIKIKSSDIIMWLLGYLYVVFFYIWLECYNISNAQIISWNGLGYSLIHITIAMFVLEYYIWDLEHDINKENRSLVVISIYVICLYNIIASNKYILDQLYPGFIGSNFVRLCGSILVDFTTMAIIYIWNRLNKVHNACYENDISSLYIKPYIQWIGIVGYALFIFNNVLKGIDLLVITNETLFNMLRMTWLSIIIFGAVSSIRIGKGKGNFRAWSQLLMILLISGLHALLIEKRYSIILPMLFIIGMMLAMNKISVLTLKRISGVVPIGVLSLSLCMFSPTSSRYTNKNPEYWFVRDLVYRFDTSDFSSTLAINLDVEDFSLKEIYEGFINAIPGKSIENLQYQKTMQAATLSSVEDYNDTVFSMGAEILGWVGIVLVPTLLIVLLEWIDNLIKNNRRYYVRCTRYYIVFLYPITELTWAMLLLNIRNALLAVVIGIILNIFIVKRKNLKRKNIVLYRQEGNLQNG